MVGAPEKGARPGGDPTDCSNLSKKIPDALSNIPNRCYLPVLSWNRYTEARFNFVSLFENGYSTGGQN